MIFTTASKLTQGCEVVYYVILIHPPKRQASHFPLPVHVVVELF